MLIPSCWSQLDSQNGPIQLPFYFEGLNGFQWCLFSKPKCYWLEVFVFKLEMFTCKFCWLANKAKASAEVIELFHFCGPTIV